MCGPASVRGLAPRLARDINARELARADEAELRLLLDDAAPARRIEAGLCAVDDDIGDGPLALVALAFAPRGKICRNTGTGELEGIDITEHGLPAYHMEFGQGMGYTTPIADNWVSTGTFETNGLPPAPGPAQPAACTPPSRGRDGAGARSSSCRSRMAVPRGVVIRCSTDTKHSMPVLPAFIVLVALWWLAALAISRLLLRA